MPKNKSGMRPGSPRGGHMALAWSQTLEASPGPLPLPESSGS